MSAAPPEDPVAPSAPSGAEPSATPGRSADPASTGDGDEPVYTVAGQTVGGVSDGEPSSGPDGSLTAPAAAGLRMATVTAVSVDLPNQFPTVVLREVELPRRQLSFPVGLADGVAVSHALRRVPTPRPLTHELFSGVLVGFDIDIVAVRLVGRLGGTYFAELDLRGRTGRTVLSCRPSDALAIALRQAVPVPILVEERLFEEPGDVPPPDPSS